jgi:hypothetical protein
MFTLFHKPPYPYLYGRSVDETMTFLEWELIFDGAFLHINDGTYSSKKRSSQNNRT